MRLDKWQKDFLKTKGNKILCTGRRVGKTEVCVMDAYNYGITNSNKTVLMIAPTERQAYILYDATFNYAVSKLHVILKGKHRPTKTKFRLSNGTTFLCLPTGLSGRGIRGYTIDRLYADECSRIPQEVWAAVTPMLLTTGGDKILLSTPAGKEGYFYDCYSNKKGAFDSFTRFFTDTETVILEREICSTWTTEQREKALELLEEEKGTMTALVYAQEYMGRFVEELRQLFPTKLIQSCMTLTRGEVDSVPSSTGDFFLGVDIASMGEDDSTFATLEGLDEDLLQRDLEVTSKTFLAETTQRVLNADNKYDYNRIGVDGGGLGQSVYQDLLTNDQTRRKVIDLNNAHKSVDKDKRKGKLLKEDMYTLLLHLMQQGKLKLLDDDRISASLMSVQAEEKDGQLKIFGTNTHITEALIRACWVAKDKRLKLWVR